MPRHSIPVLTKVQGPVVRKVDKSLHWINICPKSVESAIRFTDISQLNSDSSFEQPGPEAHTRSKT